MIKAGVIGHPIAHSKSPLIHNHWLQAYGIEGSYAAIDIPPDGLAQRVRNLVDDGFVGFNVTIPHKQAIIPLCTSLSGAAHAIGAVNTVTVLPDGSLYGDNTDAFGFINNLSESFPAFNWRGGPAVVIGAGGAARAIVWALKEQGIPSIRIANRTRERAEQLRNLSPVDVYDWADRENMLPQAHLVVNTSALGMKGQENLTLNLDALSPTATVYDIVYNPLMTPLLTQSAAKGCNIVTGIGMLLHQARPGFATWFGRMPEVTQELRGKL